MSKSVKQKNHGRPEKGTAERTGELQHDEGGVSNSLCTTVLDTLEANEESEREHLD